MTHEELLEAQNAYSRVECAKCVVNMLQEINDELSTSNNKKTISEIVFEKQNNAIVGIRHSTYELREEAFAVVEQTIKNILTRGIEYALAEANALLYKRQVEFDNISCLGNFNLWISVEDALPPLKDDSLFSEQVFVRYINLDTCTEDYATDFYFDKSLLHQWNIEGLNKNNKVTHWIPIPKIIE